MEKSPKAKLWEVKWTILMNLETGLKTLIQRSKTQQFRKMIQAFAYFAIHCDRLIKWAKQFKVNIFGLVVIGAKDGVMSSV